MNLTKKLDELLALKDEIAALDAKKKALEATVMEALEAKDLSTLEWGEGPKTGKPNKVTIVYSSRLQIDEQALKERLTPKQWSAITTVVVDNKALEDQVARGKIEASVVADCSEDLPRSPYLKVTPAK